MKREVRTWTIDKLYKMRDSIDFPDFQRQERLWPTEMKTRLINSVLTDIDIPKIYFSVKKGQYEVIDGQQRLWAIWDFLDDVYEYKDGRSTKKFSKLGKSQQQKILGFELQVTELTDADDKYLRELFLRLQLGLLLITGEKLHALTGLMKDFIFQEMAKHNFIVSRLPRRRYVRETLCAQICINSFERESDSHMFARTRYEDLREFFSEYSILEGAEEKKFEQKCKSIMGILDILDKHIRTGKEPIRNRSLLLSLFLFAEELIKERGAGTEDSAIKELSRFFTMFMQTLKKETEAGIGRKNEKLYRFESYLHNASGERYQIEHRHDAIKEFFQYFEENKTIMGET